MGEIRVVIPKTNPILAILEPTTLFIAMAGEPESAAFKLTKSSGADVAKETTVKPITNLEISSFTDNPTDALTKYSPPITRAINPKITQTILINFF